MLSIDIPKTPGVYKIFFIDPDLFYIGSAVNLRARFNRHRQDLRKNVHHNIHLQRAYAKYGEDVMHFEVVEHVERKEDLKTCEQYYLDIFKPHFNICVDARTTLGVKPSAEARAKISKANRGRLAWNKGIPHSPEVINQLRTVNIGRTPPNKGKKASPETLAKMRAARIGVPPANKGKSATPEIRAKLSASHKGHPSHMKGKKHTPESRAKMSESLKGMSAWNKGVPMREETKEKLRITRVGKRAWNKGRKLDKPSPRVGVPLSPESRASLQAKNRATWEAKGPEARRIAVEKRRATMTAKKAAKQAVKQETLWNDNPTP